MKRGDIVKIDGAKNSYFPLRDIDTWENIKGTLISGEDICLVLQSRSSRLLGKSWNEKLIQVLTPKGQVGWLSDQFMKVIEDE